MIFRLRRRLGRLRVSQRLALLVLVPLAAVVGLAVPVVTDRVDSAQAQASIADEAETRRTVGSVLEELQRERLLSLMYLAVDSADSSSVVRQSQAVNDAIDDLRSHADQRLRPGIAELVTLLGIVRPRVLDRSVLSMVAHEVFSRGIEAIIYNIPPPTAAGTDAALSPSAPLDELLRANEQAARFGTAALVAVVEAAPGEKLLREAEVGLELYTARFTQLASVNQRSLLTAAENSQASQRVVALAANPGEGALNEKVIRIASAVETYTTLRRLVGDRIAREITDAAAEDANAALREAIIVGLLAFLLLLFVAALAAAGARSIAVPLAQLNAAAVAVARATGRELERVSDVENQSESTPALRAVPTTGPGDVADLAAAFNQVQEGAAALLERQVTTRRNVSAMFATVARRTRNLADRQLNLIDVLERQQQDPQLLERLYRLDHVATRLRRSASALLVVSGAADDPATGPMRLADVVRAAAAEIEQFTRVRLEDAVDVAAVPRVVSDLILLVAEILDNAVSYSPPPGPVTVSVSVLGEGCRISIADVGIGMSADQLEAENKRLVDRERLEIAPTRVLGLFVVGRLARRHGLTVTLLANEPQGVLAHIDLPARLLTAPVGVTAPAPQPRGMRQAVRSAAASTLPVPERTVVAMRTAAGEHFDWFGDPPMLPAGAQPAMLPGPMADDETGPLPVRGGADAMPLAALGMPRAGRTPPASAVPSPLVPPSVASGPIVPSAGGRPLAPAAPTAFAGPPSMPAAPVGGAPGFGGASVPPIRPGSLRDRPQLPGEGPTAAVPLPSTRSPLPPDGPADGPDADGGPVEERGGLSRRVPGRNLPSGIPAADQRDPAPVDPAIARAEAEAFSQGFARGVATVPGTTRPSEQPGTSDTRPLARPGSPAGESSAPPQWPLSAAIPTQRAPMPAERLDRDAPVSPAPTGNAPVSSAPVSSAPVSSAPVSSAPVSSAPVSAAPVSPAPVSGAPVSSAPVSAAPVSSAPVSSAPVSPAPVSSAPFSPAASGGSAPVSGIPTGFPPAGVATPGPVAPIGPTPEDAARYPLPARRVPGSTRNGWAGEDTQPVPPPAARPPAVPLDDGQLTRRVPGSHLANELRAPGAVQPAPAGTAPRSGRTQAPIDRDPQSEQLQLDAMFAGFARGAAAAEAGNGVPDRGPTNGGPSSHQPTPSYQYDSGTPNGAEPQNVERR
ncbi:hypothetical protein Voc01_047280 [Virgisporangium ochraceum]|uniref:histidine kinase n=1 Tax=Virgisporangium ochraceum TaxID=65505 RepID=A0A8J3ZUD4_9ACTN|nr:ATP-binding protein [Virgisporangium ochraceum]GIJ69811.1 hypothetical protein Voc01_047280 [Virgisporangium ochraceum]